LTGGAGWSSPVKLCSTTPPSWVGNIAVTGSDVCVVWREGGATSSSIFLRKSSDGGTSWQTIRLLAGPSGKVKDPDIAVSGLETFLAWSDNMTGNMEIFFRRSTKDLGSWKPVERLTKTAGASINPRLAVSDGVVYVLWEDDTPGKSDIYLAFAAIAK
jgi:hypothetical protein